MPTSQDSCEEQHYLLIYTKQTGLAPKVCIRYLIHFGTFLLQPHYQMQDFDSPLYNKNPNPMCTVLTI